MLAAVIVSFTATSVPLSFSVSPPASDRLLMVIETRPLLSPSVNRKSDVAKVLVVSSSVVTLLGWATGTLLTLMLMVAETVPVAASFTLKSNVLRAVPCVPEAGV